MGQRVGSRHLPATLAAADRLLLDDPALLTDAEALGALFEPLGSAGRVAAVCRRAGGRPWRQLERRLPDVRREPFYFGAAYVVWGQLP